eukprot:2264713-Amphidinium_carterae.1
MIVMSTSKAAGSQSLAQAQAKRQERNEASNRRALTPAGQEPTPEAMDQGREALSQVLGLLPRLSQHGVSIVFQTTKALLPQ